MRPARRRSLSAFLLTLALGILPVVTIADDTDTVPEAALLSTLEDLLHNLKTATWSHDIWITNGKQEHHTIADVWWTADGPIRIDVTDGDDKNSTAVLKGDTVRGFRRGMLSFAKLSFDVNHKRVLGPRGKNMRTTGFVDDFRLILAQEGSRAVALHDQEAVVDYHNEEGLPARMWLQPGALDTVRIEVRQGDQVVEKHRYFDIQYHVEIDEDLFDI